MTVQRLATMLITTAMAALTFAAADCAPAAAAADGKRLQTLIDGPQRSAENRARDRYRNPLPVLKFLKVSPRAKVVEILPGSAGYWTEILAPYLKQHGRYIAAIPQPNPERPEVMKSIADTKARYTADPANYGKVATVDFSADAPDLGPPGSADYVLIFRELHNWLAGGKAEQVLAAANKVLRRGGILGFEQHRGRDDQPQDPLAKSGYVREDFAIALIEKAGFKLVAKSNVNANPRDTKDYASGVWTLPPTYRLKDQDRAKYAAIGESDRMVLMFAKR